MVVRPVWGYAYRQHRPSHRFGLTSRLSLPYRLQAEIRLTSDVSAGIERGLTVVDVDRVAEVVRNWLVEDILKTPTAAAAAASRLGDGKAFRLAQLTHYGGQHWQPSHVTPR
jgi:hypothetical protein